MGFPFVFWFEMETNYTQSIYLVFGYTLGWLQHFLKYFFSKYLILIQIFNSKYWIYHQFFDGFPFVYWFQIDNNNIQSIYLVFGYING